MMFFLVTSGLHLLRECTLATERIREISETIPNRERERVETSAPVAWYTLVGVP